MASGLMIILANKATRLAEDFLKLPKEYIAVLKFGVKTDTLDMDGDIIEKVPVGKLDMEKIRLVLKDFEGNIEQMPPMFSAVKHKGKPLYKWARKGIEIARKPRQVTIYGIYILENSQDQLTLRISCSSGTYIRALAYDIGNAYGTGAALSGLRRTRIGNMDIKDASGIDAVTGFSGKSGIIEKESWIKSLEDLFYNAPALYIKNIYIKDVQNGRRLSAGMLEKSLKIPDGIINAERPFKGIAAVRTTDGNLIALHRLLMESVKGGISDLDKVFTKSVVIFQ